MSDLDRTFREAEQMPVADLWPGIVTRAPRDLPSNGPNRRALTIVAAIVIAALGVGLSLRALYRGSAQPEAPSPTPVGSVFGPREVITHGLESPSSGVQGWLTIDAVDVSTGESRTLVTCPDRSYYRGSFFGCLGPAAISPDRKEFAYTMNCYYSSSDRVVTCDQASGIWIGDPQGGTHQLVSFEGSGQSGSPDAAEHASFAWSPDGTSIAYVSPVAGGGLYIAREDGSNGRMLPGTGSLRPGTTPVWSPDGTRIAYSQDGTVFVVRVDGGVPIAIGSVREVTGLDVPEWSADGAYLAFGDASSGIDITDPTGSRTTRIPGASDFAWSPIDDRIAYQVEQPRTGACFPEEIDTVSADGSDDTVVLSPRCGSGIVNDSLGWSSDGDWISFFVYDSSSWRVTRSDGTTADRPYDQLREVDRLLVMSWNPCRCVGAYEPDR